MAQRGNTWELPLGDTQTYTVTIFNGQNPPAAITGQYQGTEPLPAYVWEGSNQVALTQVLYTTWQSGPAGTVSVTVYGPATLSLNQGYYRVRLDVVYNGQQSPFYNGWLHFLPIPGTAVEPPMYGTLQDLLNRAGDWLPRLQQSNTETDFLFERGRAREWLDEIVTNCSRVFAYRFDLNYALYYGSFPFGPVESPDSVIQGYLAANYLMVTGRTIECVAYKALALICEKRIEFDDEDGEAYRRRAVYYHAKASQAVRGYRCQLDTNNDGIADIAFNLGVLTFR
jgi:hypothetical protein